MNAFRIVRLMLAPALATAATAATGQTPAPQETVAPTPTPTAAPTPLPEATPVAAIPIPPAPVIALPDATPTPEPTSAPTPRAARARVPTPRNTPAAQAATPTAAPSPAPTAAPAPTPVAFAAPSPIARGEGGVDWLAWLAAGAGVALLVLLWLRYQRETPADAAVGDGEPAAASPPSRAAVRGPWLSVTLRPVRAGLNMVTAVADCEISVVNDGNAPAEAIRSALVLIAAHQGQSADIDAANAEAITRSAVPAFTLAPGETRVFRAVAAAKIEGLPTMRVGEQGGGREMLVPLVVVNLQHRDAKGGEHRTSQAFVLGVERVDSPKLAPFWLDSIRMIEQVAARTNGATLRRRLS